MSILGMFTKHKSPTGDICSVRAERGDLFFKVGRLPQTQTDDRAYGLSARRNMNGISCYSGSKGEYILLKRA